MSKQKMLASAFLPLLIQNNSSRDQINFFEWIHDCSSSKISLLGLVKSYLSVYLSHTTLTQVSGQHTRNKFFVATIIGHLIKNVFSIKNKET